MTRSPHGQRKLFAKHKVSGGKHIAPPTVESIHRAKSLSSLVEVAPEANEQRSRGRTPMPGSLKPSLSQTALHHTSPSLSSTSRQASQYRSSGALYEAAARKEAILLDRLSPGPASITSSQGGITCGAIEDPRKSSKAIDERVIINFRDKNVVIARFRDKNVYR